MNSSSQKEVLVFGSGGHSKVIIDILNSSSIYKVSGVVTKEPAHLSNGRFFDVPVLGQEESLPQFGVKLGIVAVGNNILREKIVSKILDLEPEFEFINAIHPTAVISSKVTLGKGICAMAGSIVNADTIIEDHVILNTRSSVDHDCKLDSFSSIAPGATLGGGVIVGAKTAIGLGASVIESIKIGSNVLVGAGAVVVKEVPDNLKVLGIPAKSV